MSARATMDWLHDILSAIDTIRSHLGNGSLNEGMVYDAVRMRLIEIGEAVKNVEPTLLDHESSIPWPEVARMRDYLSHPYFDTEHGIVVSTVERDLVPLEAAVQRLLGRL